MTLQRFLILAGASSAFVGIVGLFIMIAHVSFWLAFALWTMIGVLLVWAGTADNG